MPGPPFVTRNNNRGDMEVPELTSSVGINLKERIPLQRSATAISVSVPDFASHPDLAWRSRRAIYSAQRLRFAHQTVEHADTSGNASTAT